MLFLAAYTCSGVAGLVYEVTWTRQLTLHLGHTTAAASTVVGAFLLGLALGASIAGRRAQTMDRRRALAAYATLELGVAMMALLVPVVLGATGPLLGWAYADAEAGARFALTRVMLAAVLVLVPAIALGATYPLAIRWAASQSPDRTRLSGRLYAANTLGAAAGALLAGFVLLPSLGVWRTTLCGVAASVGSAVLAWASGRASAIAVDGARGSASGRPATRVRQRASSGASGASDAIEAVPAPDSSGRLWLAAGVLGLSGVAALLHELAWTRVLALAIGPTTYAFAAALAAVIAGSALGAWIGTALVGRVRHPALWLSVALAVAAVAAAATYALAGREVPLLVARQLATGAAGAGWIARGAWITAGLVVPTALCLGAAFPLALAVAGATRDDASRRFAAIYAANTAGAVAGSLAAGFVTIPVVGLQATLQIACGCLVVAAIAVATAGGLRGRGRAVAVTAAALAGVGVVAAPPWDRALMASGAYLYAPYIPADVDIEAMLKAGTLRYYREGASATVAVKTLTGTTTLTVDGKTDASNRGDMLTQALVAHLPLLLHDAPGDVAVIGLGSGVTVGAALTHPVARVDVVELSPEVVEASRFFEAENHQALADPRTHLVVGDGRSHLRLAARRYDVIVSEPSNPWIAGVAALFTNEYFAEARARLNPGGVFCQWANAYNIADGDLRAIAATFRSVFPNATAWLVGEHDVLFIGSTPGAGTTDPPLSLDALARVWATRPAAVADLARYRVMTPFAALSLVVAGPTELARYAGQASVLTDDRMPLEFSAPREIHRRSGSENGAALRALLGDDDGPPAVQTARRAATASDWRDRGRMFAQADAHSRAIDDFERALGGAPDDEAALDGLVRSAILLERSDEAARALDAARRPPGVARLVALSRLTAAAGDAGTALARAREAAALDPARPDGLEQVATLAADAGDATALAAVLETLGARFPTRAATAYFLAVQAFLAGDAAAALRQAEVAIGRDPAYAPVYDLAGAACTRLDRPDDARAMFERSLAFDAHDSAAYLNLGLLALAAGRAGEAASRFAEALWLDADNRAAREGLARALASR